MTYKTPAEAVMHMRDSSHLHDWYFATRGFEDAVKKACDKEGRPGLTDKLTSMLKPHECYVNLRGKDTASRGIIQPGRHGEPPEIITIPEAVRRILYYIDFGKI